MRHALIITLVLLTCVAAFASTESFNGPSSVTPWFRLASATTLSYSERSANGDVQTGSLQIDVAPEPFPAAGGARLCVSSPLGRYFIGGQFAFPENAPGLHA